MRFPGRLVRGPVRPDRRSFARFASLRWAALPIIDRRWTAPMSAVALGFGLFVGVAIGPATQGSLGTTKPMVIRVPAPAAPLIAEAPPASPGGHGGGSDQGPSGGGGQHQGGSPPVSDSPPPAATPPLDTIAPPPVTQPTTTSGGTTTDEQTDTGGSDTGGSASDSTTALTGTVVHRNPEAASYTIAADDGRLLAIHSRNAPSPGDQVEVEARQLTNGTYVEQGNRHERGSHGRAAFTGTVSFSDPVTGVYTVSGPGVSLLVRGGIQRNPPDVGRLVEVKARIAANPEPLPVSSPGEDGCGQPPALPKPPKVTLEQVGLQITGDARQTTTDVEGIVEGVCRASHELLVSADDVRESGHDIALGVPAQFRIGALKPGQVLKLGAEIGDAGALTLSSVAGDEGTDGAEDADLVQP
jgi:hypothetical protein